MGSRRSASASALLLLFGPGSLFAYAKTAEACSEHGGRGSVLERWRMMLLGRVSLRVYLGSRRRRRWYLQALSSEETASSSFWLAQERTCEQSWTVG